MDALDLRAARFPDDQRLFEEFSENEAIQRSLREAEARAGLEPTRARLLAQAVRVDPKVTPHLATAVERIAAMVTGVGEIESYVYNDPRINAFVTEGRTRTLVALSSAAVNTLGAEELEFVIGHELGHAAFGHTSFDVNHLANAGGFGPPTRMRLRAWQRAAEVSADRAGLACCNSIDHAASALFKVVSGLAIRGFEVSPEEFAGQWTHLLDEVIDEGDRDHWQISHPFPPLRMRAMLLYWEATKGGTSSGGGRGAEESAATSEALAAADREVSRMLTMMDPASAHRAEGGARGDLLLSSFYFWGGLHMALADGTAGAEEIARLQDAAPEGVDVAALVASPDLGEDRALKEYRSAVQERRRKLNALERHRIIYGLIDVAAAEGDVGEAEIERLHTLAEIIGIRSSACDIILQQYRQENENGD